MKARHLRILALGLITSVLAGPPPRTLARSDEDTIEAARSLLRADRQAVVTDAMQFTPDEAETFWPVYHQYRAEMNTVGDGIKHLVLEYAGLYPNVPDARAKSMLEELAALEKKHAATRAKYLKKVGKMLPAAKTLRFAQVESRLDLADRLQLAASIPLVPITGEIAGRIAEGAVFLEGTAGGIYVQTLEITAKVAAIDTANRKVTLISKDGIKQVVKVGPEAINFDQIRVGDNLEATVTEELVVEMVESGDTDTDTDTNAALVALAPKGAKPGGLIAETIQVTGTVTAIDPAKRTATLQFGDGTVKTIPVRSDVDLSKRRVGEKVLFRLTELVAVEIEKP